MMFKFYVLFNTQSFTMQYLYTAKEISDSKKGFFKYVNCKRKTRENVGPY